MSDSSKQETKLNFREAWNVLIGKNRAVSHSDWQGINTRLDDQDTETRELALLMVAYEERLTDLENTVSILNTNLIHLANPAKPTESQSAFIGSRTVDWRTKKKELEKKYSNPQKVRESLVQEIVNSTDVLEEK